jgi:hypothetical protein
MTDRETTMKSVTESFDRKHGADLMAGLVSIGGDDSALIGRWKDALPKLRLYGPLSMFNCYPDEGPATNATLSLAKARDLAGKIIRAAKTELGADFAEGIESATSKVALQTIIKTFFDGHGEAKRRALGMALEAVEECDGKKLRREKGTPPSAVLGGIDKEKDWSAEAYKAYSFQCGGVAMPRQQRPPSAVVQAIIGGLEEEPLELVSLASLYPSLWGKNQKPAPKAEYLNAFMTAHNAYSLVFSLELGKGLLKNFSSTEADEISVVSSDTGARVRVGCQAVVANALGTTFLQAVDSASAGQVKSLGSSVWAKLMEATDERKGGTAAMRAMLREGLEVPRSEAGPSGEKPFAPRVSFERTKKKSKSKSRRQDSSDSESDSESDRAPSMKKKHAAFKSRKRVKKTRETSSKKNKKKKARKDDSSDSDSSESSDDSANGGSRTSTLPCFAECFDKDGCQKKHCEYSHREPIIFAERAKYRGGKGKAKK